MVGLPNCAWYDTARTARLLKRVKPMLNTLLAITAVSKLPVLGHSAAAPWGPHLCHMASVPLHERASVTVNAN
jgi:hypothetical protein